MARGNRGSSWLVLRGTWRGFCQRWQQTWFFSVGSSWNSAEGIMNWLGSVVDSVTGGSENGSSLPVLRGTMLAKKKCARL